MNTIFKIGILIIAFIALALFAFFGMQFIALQKQAVLNEARYHCAQSFKYEEKTDTTTISYPPKDIYEKCLQEKGINP